jgi:hypothetical protein
MNQPTREEFERLEEEQRQLKERIRKLEEQQTESIQMIVRYPDKDLLQEISRKQDEQLAEIKSLSARQNEYDKGLISHSRSISVLQNEIKEARADIIAIRDSQANFRDKLETVATKEDISIIKEDISILKKNQDEQHDMLRLILRILGQKD